MNITYWLKVRYLPFIHFWDSGSWQLLTSYDFNILFFLGVTYTWHFAFFHFQIYIIFITCYKLLLSNINAIIIIVIINIFLIIITTYACSSVIIFLIHLLIFSYHFFHYKDYCNHCNNCHLSINDYHMFTN